MIKSLRTSLLTGAFAALAVVPSLPAQTAEAGPKALHEKQLIEKMTQAEGSLDRVRAMTFDFVTSEDFGGKTVKNAPYSADAVTETVQTLPDGNRIVNKNSATLYRDSEGRERREQVLNNLGPFKAGEAVKTISIWDPVAKANYSLDESRRTARKSPMGMFSFSGPGTRVAGSIGSSEGWTASAPPEVTILRAPPAEARGNVMYYENHTVTITGDTKDTSRTRTEDLGEKLIEGVKAKGTRTTFTIPAGEIGNERAIDVVSERWYSDELQTVVMTRRSDPRSGETTYKLTNLNRSEPLKSLFEVPADYSLIDNSPKLRTIIRDKKDEIFE
ncbi:MAG: hypothetical protein ABI823_14265 [Bryobacteraceae bacterium]